MASLKENLFNHKFAIRLYILYISLGIISSLCCGCSGKYAILGCYTLTHFKYSVVSQDLVSLILFAAPKYSRRWLFSFTVSLPNWRRMKDVKYLLVEQSTCSLLQQLKRWLQSKALLICFWYFGTWHFMWKTYIYYINLGIKTFIFRRQLSS